MDDEKDEEIKAKAKSLLERDSRLRNTKSESDDLAKEYFEVLDKNAALTEKVEQLEKQLNRPAAARSDSAQVAAPVAAPLAISACSSEMLTGAGSLALATLRARRSAGVITSL